MKYVSVMEIIFPNIRILTLLMLMNLHGLVQDQLEDQKITTFQQLRLQRILLPFQQDDGHRLVK